MTMSLRLNLSYEPLKFDFIAFKMNLKTKYFNKKHIVDTNIVNEILSSCQSVITSVVIQFL